MSTPEEPASTEAVVWDDEDHSRYVVEVGGRKAGEAQYRQRGERRFFEHTEIDPEISGGGIGSTLVRQALDDVRARGWKVVAKCPFFAAFIKRHPEYHDIVDWEIMERIDRSGG